MKRGVRPYVHKLFHQIVDRREAEVLLLEHLVPPGREAVDVGANDGMYTLPLAALCPHVHAFEPEAAHYARLCEICPETVSVARVALSDRVGTAVLRIPVGREGRRTILASLEPGLTGGLRIEEQEVPCGRLDELADRDVGFLKIDVEGHELAVLEGGLELIRRQRPVVLVEAEDRHRPGAVESVRRLLEAEGYHGAFVLQGRTYAIGELTAEMTDMRRCVPFRNDRDQPYVRNFCFLPSAEALAELRGRIDAAGGGAA